MRYRTRADPTTRSHNMSAASTLDGRKRSICRSFAATATCTRGASCPFNHALVDTTRILALVGDVSHLPPPPTSPFATTGAPTEQTLFLVEYTKYSALTDSASGSVDAPPTQWRMRLCGGGRATLNAGTESVSVYPAYPLKGQAAEAGAALGNLESRVFGRNAVVRHIPVVVSQSSSISKPEIGVSHAVADP